MTIRSRLRKGAAAVARGIGQVVGIDELGLALAIGLIAGGLWPVWWPGSMLVPGVVLLWIFVPQRTSLIARAPADRRKES